MSARLEEALTYRRMAVGDLDRVVDIEVTIYSHPWTRGNFADSIAAGYQCWISEHCGEVVGYAVMVVAVGEAHLLNVSIAAPWQRRGFGADLLRFLFKIARQRGAGKVFLEVRPSNTGARALYAKAGFKEISVRRGYYPAADGHEDAVVMERAL
jgi:[ribosomal protein S18]-alanine N-acetyltransferase